ncbi:hypothetical protein QJS04_geneDACA016360 [Acorus gramineus]|uniref:Uncharacterized protein n=1 Tax=Acorus gramineus TaxID=55184 RepID=A0AAV9ATT1_ACOGR|nr:hypothetical protein QJS04_geneDACA016360 [Acorus gramineus]
MNPRSYSSILPHESKLYSLMNHGYIEGTSDMVVWRLQARYPFTVRSCYDWWRQEQPRFEATAPKAPKIWGS